MTKRDLAVLAEMLGQIAYSEECLGKGIYANRGAINHYLSKICPSYNKELFWLELDKHVLTNKKLFR